MQNFWQHWLGPLLNSTFFLSLTTVVVAAFALYIYKRQRKDEIRDAATIVLSEIKNSTVIMRGIKERFKPNLIPLEDKIVLEQESWSKYKFLFINLLEPEEWEAVDGFYRNTKLYDDAIRLNGSFFDANTRQIWVSLHANYLEKLKEFHTNTPGVNDLPPDLISELAEFRNLYINNQNNVEYSPLKPVNDATYALENLNLELATSSVGVKLRELARPRPWWSFIKRLTSNNRRG